MIRLTVALLILAAVAATYRAADASSLHFALQLAVMFASGCVAGLLIACDRAARK